MLPPEIAPPAPAGEPLFSSTDASLALGYASLAGTARKIFQERDLSRVLETICEEARRILGANRSMAARIREGLFPLPEILYSNDYPPDFIEAFRANRSNSILSEVLRDKQLEVIPDITQDPREASPEDARRMGHRTVAFIPLVIEGESFGAIILHYLVVREFSVGDRQLAQALGDLASMAIEKTQLLASLESHIGELNIFHRNFRNLASGTSVDEIVQSVLNESERVMGTNRCSLVLPNGQSGELRNIVSNGISSEFSGRLGALPEPFPLGQAYLSNPEMSEPTIIPDAAADPNFGPIQASEGHKTMAVFPLRAEGRNIGALFYYWTFPREIDKHKIALGQVFADQVAIAIEYAAQKENSEANLAQLKLLSQLSHELAAQNDPGAVFDLIGRAGVELLNVDRCGIWLLDSGGKVQCAYRNALSDSYVQDVENLPVQQSCHWASALPAAVLIEDAKSDEKMTFLRDAIIREGYQSSLMLPLINEDRGIGVLAYYFDSPVTLSEWQIETAQTFADQAAVAIEKSRLLAHAKERAERLEIVEGIAKVAGSTLVPEELFRIIVSEIRRVVPCDRCVICSVDPKTFEHHYLYEESDFEVDHEAHEVEDASRWEGLGAYETLTPCYVPNLTEATSKLRSRMVRSGVRSALIIPIIRDGECVSHIGLHSLRVDAFSEEHIELLTSIAGHLGPAIRNTALYQTAEDRSSRLAVLNDLSRKITENLDFKELFAAIAEAAVDLLKADHSSIFILDEERQEFRLQLSRGRIIRPADKPFAVSFDESVFGAGKNHSVNVPELEKSNLLQSDWPQKNGLRAFIRQPLLRNGHLIGLINCMSQKVGAFSEEDLDLLGSLATQASVGLENAHLFSESQKRANRLEVTGEIARVVGSTLEPHDLFHAIVREIRRAVPCTRCSIVSVDVQKKSSSIWHSESDIEEEPLPLGQSDDFHDWIIREVYASKQLKNIPDLQEADFPWAALRRDFGFKSMLFVPILQGDRCVAHLALSDTEPQAFGPDDEDLLSSITGHMGSAIRNATLYKTAQERASRLEIGGEIAKAVGSTLEPEELFRTIVSEIRRAVPCERCVIATIDRETNQYRPWHVESDIEMIPREQTNGGQEDWWEKAVYDEKRGMIFDDLREISSPRCRELVKAGLQSAMFIPILQNNYCIAHLGITRTRVGAFTEDDKDLLSSIAGHLGSAIRNATLYGTAQERASRLEIGGEIAKAVGSTLEPEELFRTIVSEIRRAVPCERCVIATIDRESGKYLEWHVESDIEIGVRKNEYDEHNGWWDKEVYEGKRGVIFNDIREIPFARSQEMAEAGFRSTMAIPILQNDSCIAHLGLSSTRVGAFTENDKELLISIADHIGPAIRNATLFETARKRASRLEITGEIAKAVGSELEPDELFRTIVREIRKALPCERCVIASVDVESSRFHYWYYESDIDVRPLSKTEPLKVRWLEKVYQNHQVENVADLREVSSGRGKELLEAGFRSQLVLPILQDNKCIAHLSVARTSAPAFTTADEEFLVSIVSHLGPAIRNATLFQESDVRAKRLEALVEVARRITRGLEISEVLESIAGAAASLFEGEAGFRLIDGEFLVRAAATPGAFEAMKIERIPLAESLSGKVARMAEPMITADLRTDSRIYPPLRELVNGDLTAALMIVPLKLEDRVLGTLSIFREEGYVFGQEDLKLATSLADQAAIAIHNAQSHEIARARVAEMEGLQKAAKSLTSEVGLKDLLARIADSSSSLLGSRRCLLLVQSPESGIVEPVYECGLSKEYIQRVRENLDQTLVAKVIKEKRAIALGDVLEDQGYPFSRDVAKSEGFRSLLVCPLVYKEKVFGVVSFYWENVRDFLPAEVNLAQAFADNAAIAIQNARLHEEERRSRDFFRSVVDDNADAIIITDTERRILIWNASAEKLYGYTAAEMIGEHVELTIREEERSEMSRKISEVSSLGEPAHYDVLRRRKDGSIVPVAITVSPVKQENGKIIGLVGIHQDLTERKQAEETLLRSKEEAEAANNAKSEFLSNMSHELRSPLNAVIGFSDILLLESQESNTLRLVEKIKDAGNYLTRLIEEILDLDRIEEGKVQLNKENVEINKLVSDFAASWNTRARGFLDEVRA